MNNALQEKFAIFRKQIRMSIWLFGLGSVLFLLVGTCLLIGYLDWSWHINHDLARFLIGSVSATVLSWVSWRFLIQPLRTPLTDFDLARRLEIRFPELQERLLSATQFSLQECDRKQGSATLQKHLVDEACQLLDQIDTQNALNKKLLQRAVLLIAGSALVFMTAICLYPTTSYTALRRFVTPFRAPDWPQQDELIFVDENLRAWDNPTQHFPDSQPIKLRVLNRLGPIPSDAKILFQSAEPAGPISERKLEHTTIEDEAGELHILGIAELPTDAKQLFFRAVGGDDYRMSWQRAVVLPAPEITEVEAVVEQPDYSGLPSTRRNALKLNPVFEQSHLIITGKISQNRARLKSAQLQFSHLSKPLMAKILRGGHAFQADIELLEKRNCEFSISVTDINNLHNDNSNRYQIQVIEDEPPVITISTPASSIQATNQATIPLRVMAKDDISLRQIRLRYRIGQSSQQDMLMVPLNTMQGIQPTANIQRDWMLESLNLPVGAVVNYFIEASDDYPGQAVRWSRSPTQRIRIVSIEQKHRELEKQQALLLEIVQQIWQLQQNTLEDTNSLQNHLENKSQSEIAQQLKALTIAQKQINSRVAGNARSLQSQASKVLADLEQHGLSGAVSATRLRDLLSEVAFLESHWLTEADHLLTTTRKQALYDSYQPNDLKRAIEQITLQQQQAQNALQNMINLLADWQNSKSITTTLTEFEQAQQEINRQTTELAESTIASTLNKLSHDKKRRLRQLSDKQLSQIQKYNQLQNLLEQWLAQQPVNQAEQTYPTEAVQQVLKTLKQSKLPSIINDAATQIRDNQIGRAFESQGSITEQIKSIQNALQNQINPHSNDLQQNQALEQALARLANKQQQLYQNTGKFIAQNTDQTPASTLNEQIQKQQNIQTDSQAIVLQLRKTDAGQSAELVMQAIYRMKQAIHSFNQQTLRQAYWQQSQASQKLFLAVQTLRSQLTALKQSSQQEYLQKLVTEITALKQQQDNVHQQTKQLDSLQQDAQRWTRLLRRQLRELSESQSGIIAVTQKLITQSVNQVAIPQKLKQSLISMYQAEQNLKAQRAGKITQAHQLQASLHLDTILKAIDYNKQNTKSDDPALNSWIGTLELIKSVQAGLLEQTQDLEVIKSSKPTEQPHTEEYLSAAKLQNEIRMQLVTLMNALPSSTPSSPNSENANAVLAQTKTIAGAMQSAANRLQKQLSDSQTQRNQQQALSELSSMITKLQKNWQQIHNQLGNPSPQQPRLKQPHPKDTGNLQADNQQKTSPQNNTAQSSKSNTSAQQAGQSPPPNSEKPARLVISPELLVNDIWGHLPPRLRNRMLNMYKENYLPKYDRLVQKYFEELATPTDQNDTFQ